MRRSLIDSANCRRNCGAVHSQVLVVSAQVVLNILARQREPGLSFTIPSYLLIFLPVTCSARRSWRWPIYPYAAEATSASISSFRKLLTAKWMFGLVVLTLAIAITGYATWYARGVDVVSNSGDIPASSPSHSEYRRRRWLQTPFEHRVDRHIDQP
jgi:hypothetical protein